MRDESRERERGHLINSKKAVGTIRSRGVGQHSLFTKPNLMFGSDKSKADTKRISNTICGAVHVHILQTQRRYYDFVSQHLKTVKNDKVGKEE